DPHPPTLLLAHHGTTSRQSRIGFQHVQLRENPSLDRLVQFAQPPVRRRRELNTLTPTLGHKPNSRRACSNDTGASPDCSISSTASSASRFSCASSHRSAASAASAGMITATRRPRRVRYVDWPPYAAALTTSASRSRASVIGNSCVPSLIPQPYRLYVSYGSVGRTSPMRARLYKWSSGSPRTLDRFGSPSYRVVDTSVWRSRADRDHPRSCGEHDIDVRLKQSDAGSSPLVRGTHLLTSTNACRHLTLASLYNLNSKIERFHVLVRSPAAEP